MKFTAIIIATTMLTANLANAMSLDEARSGKMVCEQADGMLKATSDAAASLVQGINAQRMTEYQSIASSTGASITQVQQESGAKLQAKYGGC